MTTRRDSDTARLVGSRPMTTWPARTVPRAVWTS
ncbi:Uncharacterised protein [Bordetella pertussis]|nr:Uncharacterised protein [Bordetella pertussis]